MASKEEQIAAYLDGEMRPEDAAAFEVAMQHDATLAADVARWRGNDALVIAAFDDQPDAAMDDNLLRKMGLLDDQPGGGKVAEVVNLADARSARRKSSPAAGSGSPSRWWPVPVAIAAGLAALLILPRLGAGGEIDLARSTAFQTAMQSVPSSQSTDLEDGRRLTLVLSFAAGDGRYCREFRLAGDARTDAGIACREDRTWAVAGMAEISAPAQGAGGIATASGPDGSALDDVYSKLNASDPLDQEDENRRISEGWDAPK